MYEFEGLDSSVNVFPGNGGYFFRRFFFFFRILVIFAFIKRLIWGVGSQDYGG